jgi:hypothetical protein
MTLIATAGPATTRADYLVGIGERFGLYRVLGGKPVTARQLAAHTFTDIHFVKEWLAQQVDEGYVVEHAGRYSTYCDWPRSN